MKVKNFESFVDLKYSNIPILYYSQRLRDFFIMTFLELLLFKNSLGPSNAKFPFRASFQKENYEVYEV